MSVGTINVQALAIDPRARVEEFQRKHRVGLLTLLFTDVVDSARLKQTLGEAVPGTSWILEKKLGEGGL
jgi:hypothetical protein